MWLRCYYKDMNIQFGWPISFALQFNFFFFGLGIRLPLQRYWINFQPIWLRVIFIFKGSFRKCPCHVIFAQKIMSVNLWSFCPPSEVRLAFVEFVRCFRTSKMESKPEKVRSPPHLTKIAKGLSVVTSEKILGAQRFDTFYQRTLDYRALR